ncbi:BclA C-terminal domain-containing protein [Ilumatobacter sp.]|uniref:BclA C-terminal domain-containing protein n=1 Tax=Ilumatobacter sp. TaxID=1967498 RepID=UPI003B5256D7
MTALGAVSPVQVSLASPTVHGEADTLTASEAEVFVSLSPQRALDTRTGVGVASAARLGERETITLEIAGVGSVPSDATSVAINTTFPKASTEPSFVTIWPTGDARPTTSANNSTPGQETPNLLLARLGDGGAIDIYNDKGEAHFVVDVVGYFVPADSVSGLGTGSGGGDGRTLVGDGEPTPSSGSDGDTYLDRVDLVFYGPKTTGGWGAGVDLTGDGTATSAGEASAISARTEGGLLDISVLGSSKVPFDAHDVRVGTDISLNGSDEFVFARAGTYRVAYDFSTVSASLLGSDVELRVDGVARDSRSILSAGVPVSGTTLVEVGVGDVLSLHRVGALVAGVAVDASIVIDLVARA